jgi:hypothetical protein
MRNICSGAIHETDLMHRNLLETHVYEEYVYQFSDV